MFSKIWNFMTEVRYADTELDRIKYSILRGIAFCFGICSLILVPILYFSAAGEQQDHASLIFERIWFFQFVMFFMVWSLLGTKLYQFSLLVWAVGFAIFGWTLITNVPGDGTVYRAQIFLLLALLVFSVYLRRKYLYTIAISYYLILIWGIWAAGLARPQLVLPFTLACIFSVLAMELVSRMRDTSARIAEEQRAKALHSSRLSTLGETTAFIVHEVSSPLSVLAGHLELLRKNENPEYHLEKMQNSLNRAMDFITSVKTIVRSTHPNEYEVVQLSEILKIVSDLVEPRLRRNNIRLEFEYAEDLELKCRPAEIAQVLINLINNSADALSGSNLWIRVSTKQEGQFVDFEVSDPGSGIDPALVSKIMDPFFTTKRTGSGIGLAIANQVANQHDGNLEVVRFKNPTTLRLRLALIPKFVRNGYQVQS